MKNKYNYCYGCGKLRVIEEVKELLFETEIVHRCTTCKSVKIEKLKRR